MQIIGNTGAPHNPLTILSCGKILQMSPVHNLIPLPFPETESAKKINIPSTQAYWKKQRRTRFYAQLPIEIA